MASSLHVGLLLPHFGEHADPETLLMAGRKAEEYGFDSVWVRDHLVYQPHSTESPDRTFVEAFTVLASLGSVTDNIGLGTLVSIPTRHPLHLAQLYASLEFMAPDRVIPGIGAGNFEHEFDAVDLPFDERQQLVSENIEVIKQVWREGPVDYEGELFGFENVELHPRLERDAPLWFGGKSPAAMQLALEYADGWNLGRATLRTADTRRKQVARRAEERGIEPPAMGTLVPTSIDEDPAVASAAVDIDHIVEHANGRQWWVPPESGRFDSLEDLQGALVVGAPADAVADLRATAAAGVEQVVIDFRHRFDRFEQSLDLFGTEVLPQLN